MNFWKSLGLIALAASIGGCSSSPEVANFSGKVTFKGAPVPAGYISFTPDVTIEGPVKVMQIKDGAYDSSKEPEPGVLPGKYKVRIAGFDGVKIPFFGQGKQIFNPVDEEITVTEGMTAKDFVIPDSAGQNVKIERTADT